MSVSTLTPLHDRVILKPVPTSDFSEGGIFLPVKDLEANNIADVISVGPGRLDERGNRVAMGVKAGDRVMYAKYSAVKIQVGRDELWVLRESEILCIVPSTTGA